MMKQSVIVGPIDKSLQQTQDQARARFSPPRRLSSGEGITLLNSWATSSTSPVRLFIDASGWCNLIGYLVTPASAGALTIASFPEYKPELTWRQGQELSVATGTVAAGSRWLEIDTSGNLVTNATLAAATCTIYASLRWFVGG